MSAEIIQFIPKPNPNRDKLKEQAAEILSQIDTSPDGLVYESSIGFVAPEADPA